MLKKWIGLIALPLSCVTHANMVDVYLSSGASFSRLANNEYIQINDVVTNQFITDKKNVTSFIGGAGVGHTFENIYHKPISIAFSLMGYYTNFDHIKGLEYPFINAEQLDSLSYQFKAESAALMVESRFRYTQYAWQPFLLLGIGASWNHLYNYSEFPTDPNGSAVATNTDVDGHTMAAFAYEVGIGIQHLLFTTEKYKAQWIASLDYRYMNFGKGQLGDFTFQTVDDPLTINHLDTQALMFTLEVSV
jgi:hypothetical protein